MHPSSGCITERLHPFLPLIACTQYCFFIMVVCLEQLWEFLRHFKHSQWREEAHLSIFINGTWVSNDFSGQERTMTNNMKMNWNHTNIFFILFVINQHTLCAWHKVHLKSDVHKDIRLQRPERLETWAWEIVKARNISSLAINIILKSNVFLS